MVHMGTRRGAHRVWWGVLKEIGHLEDLGLSGRITLNWVFKTWDREIWSGLIWLRIGTGECGNEFSGSIKCREFLTFMTFC